LVRNAASRRHKKFNREDMPRIEVSVNIKKPKREVYKVISDMEKFPDFMRDVKSLRIVKRVTDEHFITLWEIDIDGAPINWKEEVFFDQAGSQIKFSMMEGSYKKYHGAWSLQDSRLGTKLTMVVEFDWGIPILEKYVGKALEVKARRGLLGMIQAIKKEAENNHV